MTNKLLTNRFITLLWIIYFNPNLLAEEFDELYNAKATV